MADLIIPNIGTSGYYELRTPYDTLIVENERYTCKAVRKISDYLANNEDVKKDIYTKYTLGDTEYDIDAASDMPIVSLQSTKGHWLYVPAKYIITYPIANGIPYRSFAVGVSLPAMPANRDYSFIKTEISNLVTDVLGVTASIEFVETSRVTQIPSDKHTQVTADRQARMNGQATDRSRYKSLLTAHQTALDKIAALEAYIKLKHT